MKHRILIGLILILQHICLYGQTNDTISVEIGQIIISLPSKPIVRKFPTNESFELRTPKGFIIGNMYDLSSRADFKIIPKDSLKNYYLKSIKLGNEQLNATINDITFIKLGNNEGIFYTVILPSEMKNYSYDILILIDKKSYSFSYSVFGDIEPEFTKEQFINLFRIKK